MKNEFIYDKDQINKSLIRIRNGLNEVYEGVIGFSGVISFINDLKNICEFMEDKIKKIEGIIDEKKSNIQ